MSRCSCSALALLFLIFLCGVNSQCVSQCPVNFLNVWPGSGYHAFLEVQSPVYVRAFRFVRIFLQFDRKFSRAENVHVRGGVVRRVAVRAGNTLTFLFGPDTLIQKGTKLRIEFIIRESGQAPSLKEVRLWKKVACSDNPCPGSTTSPPATTKTARPTVFMPCSNVQRLIQSGPDFFKVELSIPITKVLKGWAIELQFTKPVIRISNFAAHVDEERESTYFRLVNFPYNEVLQPGVFTLTIMVHYSRSEAQPPKIAMIKLDSFHCKIKDTVTVVPTQPSTTTVTTTVPATTTQTTTIKSSLKVTTTASTSEVTTAKKTTQITTEATSSKPATTSSKPATTQSTPRHTSESTAKTDATTQRTLMPTSYNTTTSIPTTTTKSPPSCVPKYDYDKVLNLSLLFYEAQRSGKLPTSNRIPYRMDSALGDGSDVRKDLSGGYYDAGDFVKFGFPMAYTITVLSWGVLQYKDGYQASGQYQYALDAIKWGTDYFIKCHTAPNEFYGQVGDGDIDHAYWGRPEEMTMRRPSMKIDSTKPGTELAGETAAALAAAHLVFRQANPSYAATLLSHARELYNFANTFRGTYSNSIPNAAKFYRSYSGYNDELTWAAAWLYRATIEQKYLDDARKFYFQFGMGSVPHEFSWDDKKAGVQVLMAQITKEDSFKEDARAFCDAVLTKDRTPKGLVFISQWGSNRHASNVAFICLLVADLGIKSSTYRSFARSQIHYVLGDSGRSYVVGFGNNPPQRPHHGSSSCPNVPAPCGWNEFNNPNPNPQILYGALVGGPDKNDFYVDDRKDYIKNEVACDYNAGFQSAVAALRHLQKEGTC